MEIANKRIPRILRRVLKAEREGGCAGSMLANHSVKASQLHLINDCRVPIKFICNETLTDLEDKVGGPQPSDPLSWKLRPRLSAHPKMPL